MSEMQLATTNQESREKLVASFKFIGMNRRANMVHDSFQSTFEWLFQPNLSEDESARPPPWDSFITWLGSDARLYWISGKPGSGKSTLMKFIVSQNKTRSFLEPNTITISHFIWIAGAPMKRDIRGVLFSLLHKLLTEEPGLVDKLVLENRGLGRKDSDDDWSFSELPECLLSSLGACPRPVCIFFWTALMKFRPATGLFS